MTDNALDLKVAEAMGLDVGAQCPCDPEHDIVVVDEWQWRCEICGTTGYVRRRSFRTDVSHSVPVRHYSTDTRAARVAEDWIEEHGLEDRYLQGMMDVLIKDKQRGGGNRLGWDLLHATPEQRCRAFLAAMEGQ